MSKSSFLFFEDLTRAEVCRMIADEAGMKDGVVRFTDKDFAWVEAYDEASAKPDWELLEWCRNNL